MPYLLALLFTSSFFVGGLSFAVSMGVVRISTVYYALSIPNLMLISFAILAMGLATKRVGPTVTSVVISLPFNMVALMLAWTLMTL